jgi:hypothetical protein
VENTLFPAFQGISPLFSGIFEEALTCDTLIGTTVVVAIPDIAYFFGHMDMVTPLKRWKEEKWTAYHLPKRVK